MYFSLVISKILHSEAMMHDKLKNLLLMGGKNAFNFSTLYYLLGCLNLPPKSKKEREGESLALPLNSHTILGYLFNLIQVSY